MAACGITAGDRGLSFGAGILNGIGSMFGAPSIHTAYDKLNDEIQDEADQTQQLINSSSLASAQLNEKFGKELFGYVQDVVQVFGEETNYYNKTLNNKIFLNKINILYLFIIVMIYFIYFSFKK